MKQFVYNDNNYFSQNLFSDQLNLANFILIFKNNNIKFFAKLLINCNIQNMYKSSQSQINEILLKHVLSGGKFKVKKNNFNYVNRRITSNN